MERKPASQDRSLRRGKLRIGNDWNAITIIALSQSNPLKAVAELVENSIDARATYISITRGRSEGNHYLEIRDEGQGIPRDAEGRPDLRLRAPDETAYRMKTHREAETVKAEIELKPCQRVADLKVRMKTN